LRWLFAAAAATPSSATPPAAAASHGGGGGGGQRLSAAAFGAGGPAPTAATGRRLRGRRTDQQVRRVLDGVARRPAQQLPQDVVQPLASVLLRRQQEPSAFLDVG